MWTLCGLGKMGQEILSLREKNKQPIEGFSSKTPKEKILTLFKKSSLLLDFSSPMALESYLPLALELKLPLLIGTTGYAPSQKELLEKTAKHLPIFYSSNFSLGIAIVNSLAKQVAKLFPSTIDIIEIHHEKKKDRPSGTALFLAKTISSIQEKEPPIHSLRTGAVVGTHTLLFNNEEEAIEITHTAHKRALFAKGAFVAAYFLLKQPPGLYTMEDLL